MSTGFWKLAMGAAALAAAGLTFLAVTGPSGSPRHGVAAGRGATGSHTRVRGVTPDRVPGGAPPSLVHAGAGRPEFQDPMRSVPPMTAAPRPFGGLGSQPGVTAGAPAAPPPAPPIAAAPRNRAPAAPPVTSARPVTRLPSLPRESMTAAAPPAGSPAPVTAGPGPFIEEEDPNEETPVLSMENGENDTVWLVLYGRQRYRAELPPYGSAELKVDPGTYTVKTWSENCPSQNVGQGLFRAHRRYRARFVRRSEAEAKPPMLGELLDKRR